MSNKKESKLSNYDKHKENPFLKEAVEQIQHNIVKIQEYRRYKSKRNFTSCNSDGELVGHTSCLLDK